MRLQCGDIVYDVADPRHTGTVEGIRHSYEVKIVWDETGWVSYVPLQKLRKVQQSETQFCC